SGTGRRRRRADRGRRGAVGRGDVQRRGEHHAARRGVGVGHVVGRVDGGLDAEDRDEDGEDRGEPGRPATAIPAEAGARRPRGEREGDGTPGGGETRRLGGVVRVAVPLAGRRGGDEGGPREDRRGQRRGAGRRGGAPSG